MTTNPCEHPAFMPVYKLQVWPDGKKARQYVLYRCLVCGKEMPLEQTPDWVTDKLALRALQALEGETA